MKRLFICLFVLLIGAAANFAMAQDVVYLKNGSVIKGSVVEIKPSESLKIKTADGSLFVYKMSEVDRIERDNNASSGNNGSGDSDVYLKRGFRGFVDFGGSLGFGDMIKLEIVNDSKYLLPDNKETIAATEALSKEGFVVMPYIYPSLPVCRQLVNAGASALMPLASTSGSNKGLATRDFIEVLLKEFDIPIIVDAGIGRPSQACEAMELGCAAVMANTALSKAGNLPLMAQAFKNAIIAGREAYLSGYKDHV